MSETALWISLITKQLKLFTSSQTGNRQCFIKVSFFTLHPQKEEKSQQSEVHNGVADSTPVQTTPPPKPPSPDASLATISNINIDFQGQEDEDQSKRQVHRPQSAGDEHVTRSVHKDGKRRGKPDPSPPVSPVKLPLKSVSGVVSRGGDERRAPNGLLDIQPRATPKPGDTFTVFGEKQMSDVDDKDDTMELLQEAHMQKPKLEVEKEAAPSITESGSAHKSKTETVGVGVEVNMDNQGDTINLLKGDPTQLHASDTQVSADNNWAVFLLLSWVWINFFLFHVGKLRIHWKAVRAVQSNTGKKYNSCIVLLTV